MENNNSTTDHNENMQTVSSPSNNVNPIFYIILAVLFVLLTVIAWMYIDQRRKTDKIIAQMEITSREKDNLTVELDNMLQEYNDLQTDNDSLNVQMQFEQDKIKQMLEEVRRVKNTNVQLIAKYKNELSTLRKIMRGYIVQIDSLNTLNIELMDENVKVKKQYKQVITDYESLSEKTDDLSEKVEIASMIQTENLEVMAINSRSKEVTKAKKVDKIKICMTLDENPIAGAGMKDVYIRISSPDELILTSSADNLFTLDGEQVVFSATRQVEYQNVDIDLCIYWQNNQELLAGTYFIDVYTEGYLIGSSSVDLK